MNIVNSNTCDDVMCLVPNELLLSFDKGFNNFSFSNLLGMNDIPL
jgi:hypothetical protein